MANGDLSKTELQQRQDRILARIRGMTLRQDQAVRETVGAGITIGTAFAIGWFEKRYPDNAEILGMPVSLVIGGAAIAAAAFEVGGQETAKYLGDAGRGALAAWAAQKGAELGDEQAQEAA
jgi:hypothetical protein